MWFAETLGNRVGRITPAGVITEFTLPVPGRNPEDITAGPDGALWFTERDANRIGRMTTAGVVTNEYVIPTAGSVPYSITLGPDGALWFVEFPSGNKIGRIDTSGSFQEHSPFPITTALRVTSWPGPDGNLWFTESNAPRVREDYYRLAQLQTSTLPTAATTTSQFIAVGADKQFVVHDQ